ncbi:MAG: hypothetical protein QXT27_08245 [Pyrobaculum sp.]
MMEVIFERLKVSGKRIEVNMENAIASILWHCDMEGCIKMKHGAVIEDATWGNYLMVITNDDIEVYRLLVMGGKVEPLYMVKIPYGVPVTGDISGNRELKKVLTIVKAVVEVILNKDKNEILNGVQDKNETKEEGDVFVERI